MSLSEMILCSVAAISLVGLLLSLLALAGLCIRWLLHLN